MKIKISILVLLILSLISVRCSGHDYNIEFDNLESKVMNKSTFVENSVKVQYLSENNIIREENKIKNIFKGYEYSSVKSNEMHKIFLKKGSISIESDLWYRDGKLYVETVLVNNDKRYSTYYLYKLIKKLDDELTYNEQYYYCYKGKIKKTIVQNLIKTKKLKNPSLLTINNGYTGVAQFNNNREINFAEVKYDSGLYIIIATPIIFITY